MIINNKFVSPPISLHCEEIYNPLIIRVKNINKHDTQYISDPPFRGKYQPLNTLTKIEHIKKNIKLTFFWFGQGLQTWSARLIL